jgi:hypothetical protein
MRSTLGIAVFSGMLGVTLFGIFLTPVFYYVIVRLFGQPPAEQTAAPASPAAKVVETSHVDDFALTRVNPAESGS